MKIKYFTLMSFCATILLSLGSCSKDDNDVNDGKTQNLVIKFSQKNVSGSRLVDDPMNVGTGAAVNAVWVFLLNNEAVVKSEKTVQANITEIAMTDVPASVNRVILVANADASEDILLAELKTATAIKNYPFKIEHQNSTEGIADKTMMGEGVPHALAANKKEVDIALKALTARIEICAIKEGKGVKSVKLLGVWINNYYPDGSKTTLLCNDSDSPFWEFDNNVTTGFSSNPNAYNSVQLKTAYDPSRYYNVPSSEVKLASDSRVYAFHLFAEAATPHIILLVSGEYADDNYSGNDQFFLQWVTFTKFYNNDNNAKITDIETNHIYKVGSVVDGISISSDIMTSVPEMQNFDLGINVSVVDWTAVNVTPGV